MLIAALLLAIGIALLVQEQAEQEKATRGWELATENENMPQRESAIAGINVELRQYETGELDNQLRQISDLGFTWLRQTFAWEEIQPTEDEWQWQSYDSIVEAVAAYPNLGLIAVLDGTPAWARDPLSPEHPFSPPASATQYAEFTRAVAERYGDNIDHYQLWDEPNLRSHWGNTDPKPAIYTAMIRAAYPAIHAADEGAEVILAALAPTVEQGPENYNELSYLSAIYEHGGGDYFDAAAGKPYGYNAAPDNRELEGDFNFSRIILMRELMIEKGDGDKGIWGSNFGWNHLPNDWQGPPSIWGHVSADEQIRYTKAAYERARDEWPWMQGLILQHWQPDVPSDDPIQGFAVSPNVEAWQDAIPSVEGLIAGQYTVQNPFTSFDGEWQFGPLGADALPIDPTRPDAGSLENQVEIQFYGTEFGLLIRRYDVITGYYIVLIDGAPANALPQNRQGEAQIVLKATDDGESLDLILAASGLEKGFHTATILHRPRQGDDAWALAGIAVGVAPDDTDNVRLRWIAYALIGLGGLLILLGIWRAPWRQLHLPSQESLQNAFDLSLSLVLSLAFILGSALTWGEAFTAFVRRDPPAIVLTLATVGLAFLSPIAIISVLCLLAFGVVVFNRPLMGVLAVMFWSMFFSSNIDAYIRLIAAVEAMLAITLAAVTGRAIYEWSAAQQKTAHQRSWRQLLPSVEKALGQLHAIDIGVMAMVILASLSISWAELRPEAIHELRLMILGPAVFYVVLRLLPFDISALYLLLDTIIIGGSLLALIGLYNFVSGDVVFADEGARRLVAVYGSPNAVALQLGRCLPFAAAYVFLPLSEWRRIFGGIAAGIMLLAFLLTQSIGGIVLGLPIAIAVFLLLWRGQKAWSYVMGLAGLGIVALFPLSRLFPRLQNLSNLSDSSSFIRVNVWRSAIEMIEDYPLRGFGLDQFLYAYRSRYILPEGSADPNLSHPHNIVFEHWIRFGALGVFVLLWIQISFWQTLLGLWREAREKPHLLAPLMGVGGSMAYVLAHGLIDASLVFINLSYMYLSLLAIILILRSFSSEIKRIG